MIPRHEQIAADFDQWLSDECEALTADLHDGTDDAEPFPAWLIELARDPATVWGHA